MDKRIKRIGALAVFGMMVLIMIAPTPSAVPFGSTMSTGDSHTVVIDFDNDSDDAMWTVWHDRGNKDNPPGEELFRIQEDGKVGIGEPNPTHTLDVNGSVRVRDLTQDDTLNDIVVADANGVLHIRDVTTIGGGGGFATSINTVTEDYEVTGSDYTILADASTKDVLIKLPSANEVPGQILNIKRIDDHKKNEVVIDGDDQEKIDGDLTVQLNTKYMSYTIQSDGSGWYIIASYGFMGQSHINNKNR